MIMTASSLYEAVEPHVIWKQLLSAFVGEVLGDGKGFEVRMECNRQSIQLSHARFRQYTWLCSC